MPHGMEKFHSSSNNFFHPLGYNHWLLEANFLAETSIDLNYSLENQGLTWSILEVASWDDSRLISSVLEVAPPGKGTVNQHPKNIIIIKNKKEIEI